MSALLARLSQEQVPAAEHLVAAMRTTGDLERLRTLALERLEKDVSTRAWGRCHSCRQLHTPAAAAADHSPTPSYCPPAPDRKIY